MRTQKQIIARIFARQPEDPFGFEWQEYLQALTKESVLGSCRSLFKPEAYLDDWVCELDTDEKVKARCIEYMPFAWEKANNCRGISASRSMSHYKAWLWLLGTDDFEGIDDYEYYGKDNLVRICQFLGLDSAKWDDGVRVNSESEL